MAIPAVLVATGRQGPSCVVWPYQLYWLLRAGRALRVLCAKANRRREANTARHTTRLNVCTHEIKNSFYDSHNNNESCFNLTSIRHSNLMLHTGGCNLGVPLGWALGHSHIPGPLLHPPPQFAPGHMQRSPTRNLQTGSVYSPPDQPLCHHHVPKPVTMQHHHAKLGMLSLDL